MRQTYFTKFLTELKELSDSTQKLILEQLSKFEESQEIGDDLQQVLNKIMPGMTVHDYRLLCFSLNLFLSFISRPKEN